MFACAAAGAAWPFGRFWFLLNEFAFIGVIGAAGVDGVGGASDSVAGVALAPPFFCAAGLMLVS